MEALQMNPLIMKWIKKIGVFIVAAMVAALGVMLIVSFLNGCMSAPARGNYANDECFTAMDCLYRLKGDKDKAACVPLVEACRDCLKEKRGLERLIYCKTNCPNGMSENECRLWLNQR
jgi:hypothetical protein